MCRSGAEVQKCRGAGTELQRCRFTKVVQEQVERWWCRCGAAELLRWCRGADMV